MDTPPPPPKPVVKAPPCIHYGTVHHRREGDVEVITGRCLKCGAEAALIEDGKIISYKE